MSRIKTKERRSNEFVNKQEKLMSSALSKTKGVPRRRELDEMQEAALVSELTAYEEATRNNNEAHKRLQESREQLVEDAIDIADAMLIAFEQKSKSIEELRAWRTTIDRESKLVSISIGQILDKVNPEKIKCLSEYVDLIERLNKIENNELVNNLIGASK